MKKYMLMMLVVLLPISSLFAQTEDERQEAYEQVNKWAVVKLTIAYIEDLRGFTESNNIDSKEYITYSKLIENYSDNSTDINLDTVGSILTNGDWSKAKKQVFDKYRTELVDSTLYNFDSVELFVEGLKSKTKSENSLEEIKVKYSEILNPSKVTDEKEILEAEISQKSNVTAGYTNRNVTSRNKKSNDNLLLYIIGGILFLSIVINFFLLSKNKVLEKKKNSLKRELKSNIEQKNDMFTQQSNNSNRDNKVNTSSDENKKLLNQIDNLEKRILELKLKNSTLSNENFSPTVDLDIPNQVNANRVIYLASPFQDSTFADEDSSSVKTTNTIYQVDFDEQTSIGVLSLIQDADYSKALNSPDSYLETACIYDNEYSNNAREVRVIEKGEIKQEGEDWIVTKKVRIKFI